MATFALSTMAFPQGATFIFGSWVCVANGSSGFNSHLTDPTAMKTISSERSNKLAGSDDHVVMLLLDLAKEIEMKLGNNSGSTQTQIDLKLNSTRTEILLAHPIYGLRNASYTYQQMIKSIYEQLGSNTLH
jgi:hypothetical protein